MALLSLFLIANICNLVVPENIHILPTENIQSGRAGGSEYIQCNSTN
jgi:hypothetical protein